MLAAIGLILILKQIPHAIGYDADYEGDETFLQMTGENTFSAIGHAFSRIEPAAVGLSLLAIVMLVVWDKTSLKKIKLLPGPLAVVLAGIVGQWVLPICTRRSSWSPSTLLGLPVPSSISDLGVLFAFPDWRVLDRPETWRIAVTLGIVASLETLLSLEATDRMDPVTTRSPDRSRAGVQGVGNVVAGLIGGLPVTGVIVRSSANVDAGAQTKLSAILHGVLLLPGGVHDPGVAQPDSAGVAGRDSHLHRLQAGSSATAALRLAAGPHAVGAVCRHGDRDPAVGSTRRYRNRPDDRVRLHPLRPAALPVLYRGQPARQRAETP